MTGIKTQFAEITVEAFFTTAPLLKEAMLDEIAKRSVEAFGSYGLRPAQILVRGSDQPFGFELTFSLFNGNGTFGVSSERMRFHCQNITGHKDLEVVQDCLAKCFEHLPLPEIGQTIFSGNAQTLASSIGEANDYLLKLASPANHIVQAGVVAYIRIPKWEEEIRLAVDRSVVYPGGLFLLWTTAYKGRKPSRETFKILKEALDDSIACVKLKWQKE